MVPLKVLTLVVAGQNQPSVLVLQPVEETPAGKARIVPIWIGPTEAAQIGMALEHVNTAVEAVVDMVTEEYHPLAKVAKDTAAGAVLIAAIMAAIAGGIIFLPKIAQILQ